MADHPTSSLDADYEAIEAAVLDTARGRWFLGEFARRNKVAETDVLLAAISRLEHNTVAVAVGSPDAGPGSMPELARILRELSAATAEICGAEDDPDGTDRGIRLLCDVIGGAALGIEEAADQVAEVAVALREAGIIPAVSRRLEAATGEIRRICRLQEIAAGRTRLLMSAVLRMRDEASELLRQPEAIAACPEDAEEQTADIPLPARRRASV